MSRKNAIRVRGLRRWVGWDATHLENRLLMSTTTQATVGDSRVVEEATRSSPPSKTKLGVSQATSITIQNNSTVPVRLVVSDIDNYDWDGSSRPDHNLDGVVLLPGQSTTQPEEVNLNAVPRFTLSLHDASTGVPILSTRVSFTNLGHFEKSVFTWTIDPKSGSDAGQSLSLSTYAYRDDYAIFTLENASSSSRSSRTNLGLSMATHITVQNNSTVPVRLVVSDIDNYDWDGSSRPDHNLDGVVLLPGQSTTQREEVNVNAVPRFTLSLHDANTGARILSTRATNLGNKEGYSFYNWIIDTASGKDAGQSLSFSSKSLDKIPDTHGVFTLENATSSSPPPKKKLGLSLATHITVQNNSTVPVRLGVSDIDNYDWDGSSRPDHNLDGVVLLPGQSTTQREEVNVNAAARFTLSLYDANTGAPILSTRAAFEEQQLIYEEYFTWNINTRSGTDAGQSLIFSSAYPTTALAKQGIFTLENASSSTSSPSKRSLG